MSVINNEKNEFIDKNIEYRQEQKIDKDIFFTFIDSGQDFICLKDENFKYIFANKTFTDAYKISEEQLIGKTDFDIMDADVARQCRATDERAINENIAVNSVESANGKIYETRKFPVKMSNDKIGVGSFIRDITTNQQHQEIISKIAETNRIITECMIKPFENVQEQLDYALHEAVKLTDSQYGYIYLYDEESKELILNSWTNGVMPDCAVAEKLTRYSLEKTGFWGEVIRQSKPVISNDFGASHPLKKGYPEGHVKIEKFMSLPIYEDEKIVATIGFANKKSDYSDNDVQSMTVLMNGVWIATKKREKEKVTEYLVSHDYLTGLYNRRYFEENFVRAVNQNEYPVAILIGDVNGFKTYNDTFGHLEGDKALIEITKQLKNFIGDRDIFARIGGDEFAIILSGKSEEQVRSYLDRLEKEMHNMPEGFDEDRLLTVSWGYGIQRSHEDMMDTLFKEAETFMYSRKYYSQKSVRSNTVNVTMKTLFAKSEREKNHSERVGMLCEAIGKKMLLEKGEIDRLRVAGYLHDIGKIGIDEKILNKIEKLTRNEWEMMKLHASKGAAILENTTEFGDIADFVLSHHERYDGLGYPNSLIGEKIPLGSRIISVADAYDAMTNERPYRKALSNKTAINELENWAGKQFDPKVVDVFINEVLPEEPSPT